MGQHWSKSSVEARVIFQRSSPEHVSLKEDPCSTPPSVVRIQRKVPSPATCIHPSARTAEKPSPQSWPLCRRDTEGLVYVMDNPTGERCVPYTDVYIQYLNASCLHYNS
ncbi:hypothetical protein CHARACLAT_007428 [Characodon lateralis]|uniref:Uncharacterized protein n=1 Tax=Characodon lateralis TaxID=208331 RepID=A0ABU7E7S6_9TELE|nr:hypothetical protein [Characodon lateralis]